MNNKIPKELENALDRANKICEQIWPIIQNNNGDHIPSTVGLVCALLLAHTGEGLQDIKEKKGFLKATIKMIDYLYNNHNCKENNSGE